MARIFPPITPKAACFPERPRAMMIDMGWKAIDRPGIMPGCFTPGGSGLAGNREVGRSENLF